MRETKEKQDAKAREEEILRKLREKEKMFVMMLDTKSKRRIFSTGIELHTILDAILKNTVRYNEDSLCLQPTDNRSDLF